VLLCEKTQPWSQSGSRFHLVDIEEWTIHIDHSMKYPTCHSMIDLGIWRPYKDGQWGPLHTRAKGCDHDIVRALDSHPKDIPWELGKPFSVKNDMILINHETLSIICHVRIHINSLSIYLWTLRPSSPSSGQSRPFRPMIDPKNAQWSRAFGLVCEVAPSAKLVRTRCVSPTFWVIDATFLWVIILNVGVLQ
jgi:hypothetical protein